MLTRFFQGHRRRTDPRPGGPSLIRMLFPPVVLVVAAVFLAVQILGNHPDTVVLSFAQRINPGRLARETGQNLPMILLLVGLMMGSILLTLHLGLRPLRKISEQAASIGPATISQRLPLNSAPKEVAPLVSAFNAALDRLEAGWRAQREFSANAAHELRTPLATLRAQVENLLEQVESLLKPEDRKDAIEEFDRLSRLIAQLLTLAEADNSEDRGQEPFDLVEVARGVTSELASPIVSSGRGIAFDSAHDHWECRGSAGLVEVALRNLLENAMRHTPAGSEILVSIDGAGQLAVSDDGPGVPPEFRDRIFHRFSKVDARGPGVGLGLSIVSRVMALHGGEARLDARGPGACFVLDFSGRGDPRGAGGRKPLASRPRVRSISPFTTLRLAP